VVSSGESRSHGTSNLGLLRDARGASPGKAAWAPAHTLSMRWTSCKGRFGQAGDRHRAALAQRQQARVAKAADRHRIRRFLRRALRPGQRRGPGVQRGVGGYGIAGFIQKIKRAKVGGNGAHLLF